MGNLLPPKNDSDGRKATTTNLRNETFDAHVGAGQVLGNLSSISVGMNDLGITNATVGKLLLLC